MAESANDHTTTSNGRDTTQRETKEASPRDSSPDKIEKLKQLNDILLKETKEKREQVSQLQSKMEEIGLEYSFASETEREILHAILSALVINLSVEVNARLREMEEERQKEAERGTVLEGKVESLMEEVQAEREKGRLVEMERIEVLDQLGRKEEEAIEMGKMVKELETVKSELERSLSKVSEEKGALEREGIERLELISNLRNEKKEVENFLGEFKELVKELKIKVEDEVKDRESKVGSLENEKEVLEAKIASLNEEHASEVSRLSAETEDLNQKKAEKEGEIRDLKATIDGKNEKIVGLRNEIDILQLAVEEAKKRGGFWNWIYPAATTILAAISFVYAARAR